MDKDIGRRLLNRIYWELPLCRGQWQRVHKWNAQMLKGFLREFTDTPNKDLRSYSKRASTTRSLPQLGLYLAQKLPDKPLSIQFQCNAIIEANNRQTHTTTNTNCLDLDDLFHIASGNLFFFRRCSFRGLNFSDSLVLIGLSCCWSFGTGWHLDSTLAVSRQIPP